MAQGLDFIQIFGLGASSFTRSAMRIGIVLLVLAILDYVYQRYRIEKELKMTKQEVKEEMRRMEGDPKIKQRRRQIAMQMRQAAAQEGRADGRRGRDQPDALRGRAEVRPTTMHAPSVVAKGQDLHRPADPRNRRRRTACRSSSAPPLARALYKLVEVGQEIPEQFYAAVAEILAYVYELTRQEPQSQTAVRQSAADRRPIVRS